MARTRAPKSLISNIAPNPFSQRTWVSMDIPHPDPHAPSDGSTAADDAVLPVKVTVFDVRGRRVRTGRPALPAPAGGVAAP